jgi:hypothetical protein
MLSLALGDGLFQGGFATIWLTTVANVGMPIVWVLVVFLKVR